MHRKRANNSSITMSVVTTHTLFCSSRAIVMFLILYSQRNMCKHLHQTPFSAPRVLTIAVAGARTDAHAGARCAVELHHVRAQKYLHARKYLQNIYVLGNICKYLFPRKYLQMSIFLKYLRVHPFKTTKRRSVGIPDHCMSDCHSPFCILICLSSFSCF
jgi:hypothetical protein